MAASLRGKIALVTGAGTGIGKAVAHLFAKEGATVVGVGLAQTSDAISQLPQCSDGPKHLSFDIDVSSEEKVSAVINEAIKEYNRPIHIAVNNAGIIRDGLMSKMKEEDFNEVINVNLKGTFFVSKHICNALIKMKCKNGGSIVNISSIVGKIGNIGQTNYAASKAGVIGLTKANALEYASFGIRCNAILPGFIKTAMTESLPEPIQEKVKLMIPMKRIGEPDDIAEACLFLASDRSKYITGTTLEVAGGLGA